MRRRRIIRRRTRIIIIMSFVCQDVHCSRLSVRSCAGFDRISLLYIGQANACCRTCGRGAVPEGLWLAAEDAVRLWRSGRAGASAQPMARLRPSQAACPRSRGAAPVWVACVGPHFGAQWFPARPSLSEPCVRMTRERAQRCQWWFSVIGKQKE